jgi:hypothetical protein
MAQEQVAEIHAEIRRIGIENRSVDWKATKTFVPYARIPERMHRMFEYEYGRGCWKDNDFLEDVLKHHPELRVPVKRGMHGQEYVRGR